MSITVNDYTPVEMTRGALTIGNAQDPLLTQRYFNKENLHDTNIIQFPVMTEEVNIVRFRRPNEKAAPIQLSSGSLSAYAAPIIRLSSPMDRRNAASLNPALPGFARENTDPNANLAATIAYEQSKLRRMIQASKEVMCAQAIEDGSITVYYEDGKYDTISFGFTSGTGDSYNIQPALSGDNLWNLNTAKPIRDMELLCRQIRKYSDYSGPMDVILGVSAWDALAENDDVLKKVDTKNYNIGSLSLTEGASYKGMLDGMALWVYDKGYLDNTDTWVDAFDPKKIVVLPVAGGDFLSMEYGAVYDEASPGAAPSWLRTSLYSKMTTVADPPSSQIILESDPLPLIRDRKVIRVLQVLE